MFPAFGFNAQTEEYGDMYKFGVIDPGEVLSLLENLGGVHPR